MLEALAEVSPSVSSELATSVLPVVYSVLKGQLPTAAAVAASAAGDTTAIKVRGYCLCCAQAFADLCGAWCTHSPTTPLSSACSTPSMR